MKGGNILSLLRDYDSRKSMDGSAPDAPEVSADIDSPEKPESVSGAGGFETDRTRRRTPKESEDELTAPYKRQVIRPSTPQSLTRMETLSRQMG